jgi:hypothetical protein
VRISTPACPLLSTISRPYYVKVIIAAATLINAIFMFGSSETLPGNKQPTQNERSNNNWYIDTYQRWGQKFEDDPIVSFTLFLVIFNGLLFDVTRRLVISTNKLKDITAHADRPHLIISKIAISGMENLPNETGDVSLNSSYSMTNHGQSPAILEEFGWAIACCKNADDANISISMPKMPFVIAPQTGFGSTKPSMVTAKKGLIDAFRVPDNCIYAIGVIRYRGANIGPYINRFVYRLTFDEHGNSIGFHPAESKRYWEYT